MKRLQIRSRATKIGFAVSVFLILVLLMTVFPSCAAKPPKEQVTLTLVTAWNRGDAGTEMFERFVKEINEENAGVLQIKILGALEIAPGDQQLELLRKGSIDLNYNSTAFLSKTFPAAIAAHYVECSPAAFRETGFLDIMDEMHRKQGGVTLLGTLWRGENFMLYTRELHNKADLTGMKIRSVPFFNPFIEALGGKPTVIAYPETYSALQKGIVDAAICPEGTIILDAKWYEILKYIIYPKLPWETCSFIYARADRWDALPKDIKKIIMDKLVKMEPEVYKFHKETAKKWTQELINKGMKIHELPPAEGKKWVDTAHSVVWDFVIKLDPVYGPKLKESVKKYLK